MSNKLQQNLKGFRDFGSQDMALRKEVIKRLTTVFERFGFSELQTPALEYQDVLLGKYGAEAEKLMYLFKDSGDRAVGLKYDLTVPLARYISQNQNLPLPFKRYQIQPVWRAENTQKGRYREFFQCDVDIVGAKSPQADAEIISIISESLNALKFPEYTILVNSRAVLFDVMEKANISPDKWLTVIQSIDKLDKKSIEEVSEELGAKGFSNDTISEVFSSLKKVSPDKYLSDVLEVAQKMGAKNVQFSPTISRGLDYYDGPIFETVVSEPKIGSVTGGGRYDKLLKTLGGPDLPAVGTTIGLERIVDVISELNLWGDIDTTTTKVLVTVFNEGFLDKSTSVAQSLRLDGINTEVYLETAKLEKQLKYASKKEIPYVLVIGPEEITKDVVRVKNMVSGEEVEVKTSDIKQSLA